MGTYTDNRLRFHYHVSQVCKKASKKLYALATTFKYVETSKRRVLVNSFITSQFISCAIIWMFHGRRVGQRINKIHERALLLIYLSDSKLTFEEVLDKNKTVGILQKNLLAVTTEIFKAKLNISS